MSDKLLPCPFCGKKAQLSDGGYSGKRFLVRCASATEDGDTPECPAASGTVRQSGEEAIAAWNRRYQPTDAAKYGRWERVKVNGMTVAAFCLQCGYKIHSEADESPKCPKCGAMMDAGGTQ